MASTSVNYALKAEIREKTGKGVARTLRREGKLPGIVYGKSLKENVVLALDAHEFNLLYNRPGFYSHLVDLDAGKQKLRVVPRVVQLNPVTDRPEHVDFQFIAEGEKVRVKVAVRFSNADKSPGIKRGGTLNIVRRALELWCDPNHIPQEIEIDLSGKKIAESIHISHVQLPPGAAPTITDRDFTIATIVGRRGKKEDEEGEGAAEGADKAA